MLIVHELSLTTISSSSSRHGMAVAAAAVDATSSLSLLKVTEMDVNSLTHTNKPSLMMTGMLNRLPRHAGVQALKQIEGHEQMQQHQQQIEDPSLSFENSKIKRSFSTGGGWAATAFNGLTGITSSSHHQQQQQQHNIRASSYESGQQQQQQHQQSLPQLNHQYQQYTDAKPIYEEQQENDYAGGSGSGVANAAALHSAIYNLQTAGTHNVVGGTGGGGSSASNGGSDGFLPSSWNFGKLSTSFIASQPASTPYASSWSSSGSSHGSSSAISSKDKISEGNFLHHYDSASAFNEYTPQQHEYQPIYQHQQQLQQQQQQENFYNSVEHSEADSSSSYADEHEHESSHYPPSGSAAHFSNFQHQHEQQQQEKQPDVINYVPYPVVKKQHVPVREPVQIPVSHAVIIPVSKPVPIQIPVTQNVQVPVEKELKIPVERVVPYPVEKHVPVPVEKRVPYPVVKYVPIKIPRPFPVKVPVFKTVLHKVKGWW